MKFALLLLTPACAMFARADRDRLPLLPLHLSGKRLSKPAGPRIPKAAVGQAVLCTLAVQNACQMLSMRYSRLPDQPKYLASTAVLLAEVVKILVSVAVLALQQGVPGACNTIWQGVFVNWRDTLLVGARLIKIILRGCFLHIFFRLFDLIYFFAAAVCGGIGGARPRVLLDGFLVFSLYIF